MNTNGVVSRYKHTKYNLYYTWWHTYNPINVFGQFSNAASFGFILVQRYKRLEPHQTSGWYISLAAKCCVNNTLQAQLNFNRNKWNSNAFIDNVAIEHWIWYYDWVFVTLFHYDLNDMLMFMSNVQVLQHILTAGKLIESCSSFSHFQLFATFQSFSVFFRLFPSFLWFSSRNFQCVFNVQLSISTYN